MESTELTTITGGQVGTFDPEGQLEMAIRAAKALAKVIAQKKKPVIINGEQYLEYEDWQTLGQFDGVSARTGDVEPVEIDGVKGAKAKAYLVNNKTGEIIGGAEAYCMRDEEKWGTRPKYEWQGDGDNRKRVKVGDEVVPWFQLASMAQTRAGAKTLRNKEAWIAVLAGYRPTPAEEMTESTVSENVKERRTVDKSQHYCEVHGVNFFKKGRMKNYAHPIEGTNDWCNEPDQPQEPLRANSSHPAEESNTKPPAESGTPTPGAALEASLEAQTFPEPAESERVAGIDKEWLKETLDLIHWKPGTALSWLKAQCGADISSDKLYDVLESLDAENVKKFYNHIGLMGEAAGG